MSGLKNIRFKKAYRLWPICLLFYLLFAVNDIFAYELDNGYLNNLIEVSDSKQLFERRYWDILIHYKPVANGKESTVDDPRFFLAVDGKKNPRAEMISMLESLFTPSTNHNNHPRCRFPARYSWLKEKLNIDEGKLPPVNCNNLKETLEKFNPRKAVLIYPSARLQGPGAMFGHTLIRIDGNDNNHLLSYAVNYAALTSHINNNFFSYVYNGISGGFKGYYSLMPYYLKIKEYNDIEERDIWEIQLNLNDEEVKRMFLHIIELSNIHSDYHFFSENCAFNLLFLLEAARPSLRLTEQYWNRFSFWVIPLDTIEEIQKAGVISQIKYRPALATQINKYSSFHSKKVQQLAFDVSREYLAPHSLNDIIELPVDDKIKTLHIASLLVQYRYSRMELGQKEYQRLYLDVIAEKNKMTSIFPVEKESIVMPPTPNEGHLPGRVSLGGGYAIDSFFTEIGWRPAYHDIDDPLTGHKNGVQLNLLDIKGRYYQKNNTISLQKLRLLDIISLAPQTTFFKPLSWKLNTGLEQQILRDGDEHLVYRINGGSGVAFNNKLTGITYGMIDVDFIAGDQLEKKVNLAIGLSVSTVKQIEKWWQVNFQIQWMYYGLSEDFAFYRGDLVQTFRLARNEAITLKTAIYLSPERVRPEINITWNYYF